MAPASPRPAPEPVPSIASSTTSASGPVPSASSGAGQGAPPHPNDQGASGPTREVLGGGHGPARGDPGQRQAAHGTSGPGSASSGLAAWAPGLGPSGSAHLLATHPIHLVRHLPSAHTSNGRITSAAFADWSIAYDAAGLATGAAPSTELVELAARCTVLCSPFPRTVATATLALSAQPAGSRAVRATLVGAPVIDAAQPPRTVTLAPPREPIVLPVLARANRPDVPLPLVRLRPWTWRAVTRMAWHSGWTRAVESPATAVARAEAAAAELAARSAATELVVVGHNYFNSLIAAALQRHGWAGPHRPASELGGVTTYRPPALSTATR